MHEEAVEEWVGTLEALFAREGLPPERGHALATLGFAIVRGLLFDLLATGDRARVDAAFDAFVDSPGTTTDPNAFAAGLAAAGETLGPLRGVVAHPFGGASVALAVSRGLRAERAVLIAAPSSLEVGLVAFETLLALSMSTATRMRRRLERRAGTALPDFDVASVADRLAIPVLVIHSPDDAEVPYAEAKRIAAVWPGARLRLVPGGGHRRRLRDPEVVADVVGFLVEGSPTGSSPRARPLARDFTGA